jgi:hypothetical protein
VGAECDSADTIDHGSRSQVLSAVSLMPAVAGESSFRRISPKRSNRGGCSLGPRSR